ncbi:metallophosphoesterase family protein [Yinghuangia aomiensis]
MEGQRPDETAARCRPAHRQPAARAVPVSRGSGRRLPRRRPRGAPRTSSTSRSPRTSARCSSPATSTTATGRTTAPACTSPRRCSGCATAGIRVYMVAGNHDAQSKITKELRLPANVHRFSTARPETVEDHELGIAVHGQGFADRDIQDNLAAEYPKARDGYFNVGLLHTALQGAEGHDMYAPCRVEDLTARGYDYWALGHIHARTVVRAGDPWIVFPGNLQGRHARETGPKGATLITVGGSDPDVRHHDLDAVRWEHLHVDVSGVSDDSGVLGLAEQAMRGATRDADAARSRCASASPAPPTPTNSCGATRSASTTNSAPRPSTWTTCGSNGSASPPPA